MTATTTAHCQFCEQPVAWNRTPADAGYATFTHEAGNTVACPVSNTEPRRLFIAECVDEDRSSFRAHSWITTETDARRYFDRVLSFGAELRLVGHGGQILAIRTPHTGAAK